MARMPWIALPGPRSQSYSYAMWSGRTLVLLSLAGVTAALLVTVVAGWAYGLGLYAATVVVLGLLLHHMIRQQRRRPQS